MTHDRDYFRKRAAEARASAFHKDDGEGVEVAGHLALAYSALARRVRSAAVAPAAAVEIDTAATSAANPVPLMLRD
jgi:hypothetical protein